MCMETDAGKASWHVQSIIHPHLPSTSPLLVIGRKSPFSTQCPQGECHDQRMSAMLRPGSIAVHWNQFVSKKDRGKRGGRETSLPRRHWQENQCFRRRRQSCLCEVSRLAIPRPASGVPSQWRAIVGEGGKVSQQRHPLPLAVLWPDPHEMSNHSRQ